MKTKKVFSLLLVAAMTATLLAGCGGDDKTAGNNGGGSQVLKVAAFEGGYGAEMWQEEIGRAHV